MRADDATHPTTDDLFRICMSIKSDEHAAFPWMACFVLFLLFRFSLKKDSHRWFGRLPFRYGRPAIYWSCTQRVVNNHIMAKVFDLTARYYVRTDLVTECVVFFCHLSASNQVLRIIIMGPFFSLSPFYAYVWPEFNGDTVLPRCSATADVRTCSP